jgi:arsenite methyltransferase
MSWLALLQASSSLFEQEALRAITGETIRPGGLRLTDRAMLFCTLPARSRVLDVGCGIGASVAHLRSTNGLDASGLDPSSGFLREGRERHSGMPLIQARGESLPVGRETLAAVLCECVLSLTADPRAALEEFYRVMLPRGRLIITDIYMRSAERSHDQRHLPVRSCITGAMARSEIEDLVMGSGFHTLVWEDHTQLLKELAVQLIFAHGSMRDFWGQFCKKQDLPGIQLALHHTRPGYYLLIAEKGAP